MIENKPSVDLANRSIAALIRRGVEHVVVCPGGRNAFLLRALLKQEGKITLHTHFDERSAGFFAIGLAKKSGHPSAVIVTSGTAAGELLPAAMEAWHAQVPVIFITADRPRRFDGTGAPQTTDQPQIFGSFVGARVDIEAGETARFPLKGRHLPVHWNLRFEDPNRGAIPIKVADKEDCGTTLYLIGELQPEERKPVDEFLTRELALHYCEPLSGLRDGGGDGDFLDGIVERYQRYEIPITSVLRVGGVPTHRFWRDLEGKYAHIPVESYSRIPYTGLSRKSKMHVGPLSQTLPFIIYDFRRPIEWFVAIEAENQLRKKFNTLFDRWPNSEPGLFRKISDLLPDNAFVYLGNSLPIRTWDLAANYGPNRREYSGSRGLNGIDGQVSAFLGECHADRPNFAILGDLTTMHDANGFWPMTQDSWKTPATIFTVNNQGGRIFEPMFKEPEFINAHQQDFKSIAAFWGLEYHRASNPHELRLALKEGAPLPGCIIELRPDRTQTAQFMAAYKELTS